jgi:hypothetical protein
MCGEVMRNIGSAWKALCKVMLCISAAFLLACGGGKAGFKPNAPTGVTLPLEARLAITSNREKIFTYTKFYPFGGNKKVNFHEGEMLKSAAKPLFDKVFNRVFVTENSRMTHWVATLVSQTKLTHFGCDTTDSSRFSVVMSLLLKEASGKTINTYTADAKSVCSAHKQSVLQAYTLAMQVILNEMLADPSLQTVFRNGFPAIKSRVSQSTSVTHMPMSETQSMANAVAVFQHGKSTEALSLFTQVVSDFPDAAVARYYLGLIHLSNLSISSAVREWKYFLILDEGSEISTDVRFYLGRLKKLSKKDQALSADENKMVQQILQLARDKAKF